jgi:hypothetical protein
LSVSSANSGIEYEISNIQTLTEDPLATFARRNASYVERYQGKKIRLAIAFYFASALVSFEDYFKVEIKGIENIPVMARQFWWVIIQGFCLDGAMISMAMTSQHPKPRRVGYLATDWFFTLPGLCDWVRNRSSQSLQSQCLEVIKWKS